jgi:hypothetical protein
MEKILEERSTNEQLEEVAGSRLITAGMRPAIERNCIVVPSSKLVFISIKTNVEVVFVPGDGDLNSAVN